jgi:hypothetical protein
VANVDIQISELRDAVRKLAATGPDGFEGLMAAVLTDITKTGFALANSGSQRGKDGQSALNDGAVTFEGKLYDETVPRKDILSKVAEIAIDDDGDTDLWIVGSTGPVSSQTTDSAAALGRKFAVATLIADWPSAGLPTLACVLAMAPAVAAKFIADKTGGREQRFIDYLEAVRQHPQFADRAQELKQIFDQPNIGPAYALKNNEEWLRTVFSNINRARATFGQPLAPGDRSVHGVLDRAELRQRFSAAIFGKPDGAIAAALGLDGNGKSWLFAQAWLHQPTKPLTVVLVPDDIAAPISLEALEELLIAKLTQQTGDNPTEVSKKRWRKHFERWRHLNAPGSPRLVVFLDGVNQRQSVPWIKMIDALSQVLADLGGKLVFSCRSFFYSDNLKNRLVSRVVSVEVPEWSTEELETLLKERGTSISRLNAPVVGALRNPRIFAVAAELLGNSQIEQFHELSVSRLLFEHVRTGAAPAGGLLPPSQFVREIRNHADEIVSRLKQSQTADLRVFDRPTGIGAAQANTSLAEQFVVTSSGRFFEPLPDDPSRYSLKEDGLSLALGLSLVNTAQFAHRNGLNIDEALSKILDPIAALDRTSDVLLSALLVSVLGGDPSDAVVTALARAFISLQNVDEGRYPEFRALVRRLPSPFLKALEESALADRVSSNPSWLSGALLESRHDSGCAAAIATFAHRWLSLYSSAPERMMMTSQSGDNEEKRSAEYQKRKAELTAKVAAFGSVETKLFDALVLEERGDYSRLNKTAFQFLAGTPLRAFGGSFRNWCLASAFNGGFLDARDEFNDLIQFNRVDWVETRGEILKAAESLRGPTISETGQWALVYLLSATGASPDAEEAESIFEILTRDRQKYPGWRLVENYCATDPCDPNSPRPDNIAATAVKYAAIDVSKLRKDRGQGTEDHFFEMARAGLARFEPNAAIGTIRRFAADVLTRDKGEFRLAVFELENHTAALDHATATQFVERASRVAANAIEQGDKNRELFIAAQYGLGIAFPHMTGDDQLDALLDHPRNDDILLSLSSLMRTCDPLKFEQKFENAYRDGDEVSQFRLLVFAQHTDTRVSDRARGIVGELSASPNRLVKLCAFAVICRLKDPKLLGVLATSDWTAAGLNSSSDGTQIWYGSQALILAAKLGLISVEACLERISLGTYLTLVQNLGEVAALAVAARVDSAIRNVAGYQVNANLPDIEQRFDRDQRPSSLHISDKLDPQESPNDQFKRIAETGDAWYERHLRNHEAVKKFEKELTEAGAELILESVSGGLIEEIAKFDPSIVRVWYMHFLALDANALRGVHNFASLVAQVISQSDPEAGIALFEKLRSSSPYVRVTFGRAGVDLVSVSVWRAGDDDRLKQLRFKRLDDARTDHEIAVEVLAAISAGRQETLRTYALDRQARPEPSLAAKALMVAGLSEESDWALQTLEQFKSAHGFLAEAYNAAKYAMDRHIWARHWAKAMRDARTETDLWRYGVLLAEIVDGRFHGSEIRGSSNNELVDRYQTTFDDLLRRRIDKWKDKRSKTLFGMSAPHEMFLR